MPQIDFDEFMDMMRRSTMYVLDPLGGSTTVRFRCHQSKNNYSAQPLLLKRLLLSTPLKINRLQRFLRLAPAACCSKLQRGNGRHELWQRTSPLAALWQPGSPSLSVLCRCTPARMSIT